MYAFPPDVTLPWFLCKQKAYILNNQLLHFGFHATPVPVNHFCLFLGCCTYSLLE